MGELAITKMLPSTRPIACGWRSSINAEVDKWHQLAGLDELVEANDIADVVSSWTGIPISSMLQTESEKLLHMEDALRERIVGQEKAVEAVSDAIRRARSGLKDPRRPIGTFLFLGPTGVGKTELARALAGFMFDDDDALLRIDMSEYREPHTVSRLFGAPPGYVGYDQGGQLTEQVRRRPYQVILFDEIEKAHPEVWNSLLQIHGRWPTDGWARANGRFPQHGGHHDQQCGRQGREARAAGFCHAGIR